MNDKKESDITIYEKNIKNALGEISENIEKAAIKSARKSSEVSILAVSKFRSSEEIQAAINVGLELFGENRVQEAVEKFPSILEKNPQVKLQMIGSLQRNKVKHLLPIATCIQSVDRIELIKEIIKEVKKRNEVSASDSQPIELLFEIHTAEDSKNGFKDLDELWLCLDYLLSENEPRLLAQPAGFMTMAAFTKDEKLIRASFQKVRSVQEEAKKRYPNLHLDVLSMGMTNDYAIAVEEGATMLRIGSALFIPSFFA